GGAGVEQQRPVVAEQQVHERRLEADRLALAQDPGVLVVPVGLDQRAGGGVLRRHTVDPPDVEITGHRSPVKVDHRTSVDPPTFAVRSRNVPHTERTHRDGWLPPWRTTGSAASTRRSSAWSRPTR